MKRLITRLAVLALGSAPAMAAQQQGDVVKLTPEEAQACAQGGGCVVVHRAVLGAAVREAVEKGARSCGARDI